MAHRPAGGNHRPFQSPPPPTGRVSVPNGSRPRHIPRTSSHPDAAPHSPARPRQGAPVPPAPDDEPPASTYTDTEKRAIQRVLDKMELDARRRKAGGMNPFFFTFGVLNVLLCVYVFARCPEHLWVVYLVEGLVLLPQRWMQMSRERPKFTTSWMDFCWVANLGQYFVLLYMVVNLEVGGMWIAQ